MIVFITGPVRSGKSSRAAQIAREFGAPVTFVATARVNPSDAEMTDRVARHRADRGDSRVIELWQPGVPDLPVVVAAAPPNSTLLVDSVGTWIAGHLLDLERAVEYDPLAALQTLEAVTAKLIDCLDAVRSNVVLVSEETGWGVVPPSPLGRIFRDHLGRVAQQIARRADRVELVVAGFALDLRRYGAAVCA
jgi:adenosylcobinamide kinase/adenosylcobinamide-phosphate guanylyltransferase